MYKKDFDSVSRFAARMERYGVMSKRDRENEIIASKRKEISSLDTTVNFNRSKKDRKLAEELAYTLPLEAWGFSKGGGRDG